MNKVVTRFAPSPTGYLHAGNYRSAVFCYLFAKKMGGSFILRIEDTDRARSKKEYEENILDALSWLGLKHDHFYRQSEQGPRHEELLRKLVAEDRAYISKETPSKEGGRTEVVRFRNPGEKITFTDSIRGAITFDTQELGDFVIGRSLSEPLYHFGVVVDDMDEGVTHVIRGEDHIPNTPRQILIQRALGAPTPVYAHLPLVLGADRSKLSKRLNAKAMTEYRDLGFIPEAMLNYLALLGWHPEGEQELFSLSALIDAFNLSRIQKAAGIFDEVKLRWFNKEHLRSLSDEEYAQRLMRFLESAGVSSPAYLSRATPILKERAETLLEARGLIESGECAFLEERVPYPEAVLLQGAKASAEEVARNLKKVLELLGGVSKTDWSAANIKNTIFSYATEVGKSTVLWPLRVALTGKERSPDPFIASELLGPEETLSRIRKALEELPQ
ncbi:MAG: glutamate--tRNA ligase [Patescibacteria group bacterium]|nr:glutamate--tRNA ligase [Patescibacteria group bacterium]